MRVDLPSLVLKKSTIKYSRQLVPAQEVLTVLPTNLWELGGF